MNKQVDYLPLGSVVTLKDIDEYIIIFARCIALPDKNGKVKHYDYGGALFPDGVEGDHLHFFQSFEITKVCFRGYDNEKNREYVTQLNEGKE